MASSLQKLNERRNLAAWAEMVQQCRESSLSVGEWCAAHRIAPSTYYSRQRKVCDTMEAATSNEFYEVQIPSSSGTPAATVHIGTTTAEIYNGADERIVAAIVKALRLC